MEKLALVLAISLSLAICGCSAKETSKDNNISSSEVEQGKNDEVSVKTTDGKKERNASGLLNAFIESGLPVIDSVVYSSETDPNEQLGRPGSYIEKINFNDGDFYEEGEDLGLKIEVFETKKDMEKRRDYVQNIVDNANMEFLKYYVYDNEMFLLRVPYKVTPERAELYKEVFDAYTSNKEIPNLDLPERDNEKIEKENNITLGSTFVFDELEITIGDSIEWVTLVNQFSDHDGADVIRLPIKIKNIKDDTHGLNLFYCSMYGSKGVKTDSVESFFDDSNIGGSGSLRSGAEVDAALYLLYDGDGDYYIEFDDFSNKIEAKIPVQKN